MRHLSFILLVGLTGCTLGFWQDAFSNHRMVYDQMFADGVRIDINTELKGGQPPWGVPVADPSWREFWIEECAADYYTPDMGDRYVQYIINQRSIAGLADIPELDRRQFVRPWQRFTNDVNMKLERELHDFPAPTLTFPGGRVVTNTWMSYWNIVEKTELRNPATSTNSIEYIETRRMQLGLKALENKGGK